MNWIWILIQKLVGCPPVGGIFPVNTLILMTGSKSWEEAEYRYRKDSVLSYLEEKRWSKG